MSDDDDYVDRAADGIVETIEAEHSVLHPELEARLAEAYHYGDTRNIDPHNVTKALRHLRQRGHVSETRQETRGGRVIATYHLKGTVRNKTRTERAAQRKRLLYGRYLGWAQGTKAHPHGLIGPAGEEAVRSALVASSSMQPISHGFSEVTKVFGFSLPGACDSGGYLVPVVHGLPRPAVTTLIEVKNIRGWVYPSSAELFQLLSKCVTAQQKAGKGTPLVPILICRRAHPTLFYMARQLGFVVIDTRRQWVGNVPEPSTKDLRSEVHFLDVHAGAAPSIRVQERLSTSRLPQVMPDIAIRWEESAFDTGLTMLIGQAHRAKSSTRWDVVNSMRAHHKARGGRGGW